jgi:hypothetical protein
MLTTEVPKLQPRLRLLALAFDSLIHMDSNELFNGQGLAKFVHPRRSNVECEQIARICRRRRLHLAHAASTSKHGARPSDPLLLHHSTTARCNSMSNILPLHASPYTTRPIFSSNSATPSQTSSTATIRPQIQTQIQHQAQFAVVRSQSIAMSGDPSQGPGLRYPSNKKSIYDRNLNRSKNAELSRAAFAYLFIEMIAYAQKGAKDVGDLEQRYVFCAVPLATWA